MQNDAISRTDLLRYIADWQLSVRGSGEYGGFAADFLDHVFKAVENFPSMDDGWVDAKADLPKSGETVLTFDKWGHVRDRKLHMWENGAVVFIPDGQKPVADITHWRPMLALPEKKKQGGTHEND